MFLVFTHESRYNRYTQIDLTHALEKLSTFPTLREVDGNFIGFTTGRYNTLQFIRHDTNDWLVDIPIFEGKICNYSLMKAISTEKVISLVKEFFTNENWHQTIDKSEYKICNHEPFMPVKWKFVLTVAISTGLLWTVIVLLNLETYAIPFFAIFAAGWICYYLYKLLSWATSESEVVNLDE